MRASVCNERKITAPTTRPDDFGLKFVVIKTPLERLNRMFCSNVEWYGEILENRVTFMAVRCELPYWKYVNFNRNF